MKPSVIFYRNFKETALIFCRYPMFSNMRTIGSIETNTDTEDSDIDLYVDASDEATLFDLGNLIEELENLLDVPVDIVTSKAKITNMQIKNILEGKEEIELG